MTTTNQHITERATVIRSAVWSVAYATGCVLDPDVSRPGAAVLRLCVQAPNITVAGLFAGRVRAELGATVEVTETPYRTYDCHVAVGL
jgi:hypothetical protein